MIKFHCWNKLPNEGLFLANILPTTYYVRRGNIFINIESNKFWKELQSHYFRSIGFSVCFNVKVLQISSSNCKCWDISSTPLLIASAREFRHLGKTSNINEINKSSAADNFDSFSNHVQWMISLHICRVKYPEGVIT